jgi:hypothetical protein
MLLVNNIYKKQLIKNGCIKKHPTILSVYDIIRDKLFENNDMLSSILTE